MLPYHDFRRKEQNIHPPASTSCVKLFFLIPFENLLLQHWLLPPQFPISASTLVSQHNTNYPRLGSCCSVRKLKSAGIRIELNFLFSLFLLSTFLQLFTLIIFVDFASTVRIVNSWSWIRQFRQMFRWFDFQNVCATIMKMTTSHNAITANGKLIVVANRLPFVLRKNDQTGKWERKARWVTQFYYYRMLCLQNVNTELCTDCMSLVWFPRCEMSPDFVLHTQPFRERSSTQWNSYLFASKGNYRFSTLLCCSFTKDLWPWTPNCADCEFKNWFCLQPYVLQPIAAVTFAFMVENYVLILVPIHHEHSRSPLVGPSFPRFFKFILNRVYLQSRV